MQTIQEASEYNLQIAYHVALNTALCHGSYNACATHETNYK